MKLHAVIDAVTRRITQRSAAARSAYLAQVQAMAQRAPGAAALHLGWHQRRSPAFLTALQLRRGVCRCNGAQNANGVTWLQR